MALKTPYQTVNQTDAEPYDLHDDSLPTSQRLSHGHPNSRNSNTSGTEYARVGSGSTQWSVGLMTPLVIAGFFVLATAVAVAHYLYGHYLDQKFVDNTIPQSWNAALSVAFARAFSVTLAASASAAFTQLLWWYLRRKALTLSKIDALFSLNTSPLRLFEVGLLTTTPLLWFFGLLLPLISIATIFPPGSLVVQQLPDIQQTMAQVPVLDIDYRGNGSAAALFENAVFSHDIDGNYEGPNVRFLSIGRRTLMNDAFLSRPSPCGANCSYTVSFSGPSLQCADVPPPPTTDLNRVQFNATGNSSYIDISYRAREGGGLAWLSSERKGFGWGGLRNLSCWTQDAVYSAHINYTNLIQNVTLEVVEEELPKKRLGNTTTRWPFYLVMGANATKDGTIDPQTLSFPMDELNRTYHYYQTLAISGMLFQPLIGYVKSFGDFQTYNTSGTIIQETPLAEWVYDADMFQYSDIYFKLSPSIIEQLMRNVTISMLNDATTNTTTQVTTIEFKPAYVFKDPLRLVVAYASTLGICLLFVLLGLFALLQNGTPASSGGFLQILCTTTYSESLMNHVAKAASLRGTQNLCKDLTDLEVRYGLVADSGSEKKYAAFGTVDETEVLLKGSSARRR